MLQVQGRSDLYLVLQVIQKIIAIGPLFVGALIGILPMLYFNIGVTIIAYFLNSYYSGKFLGYSSWMQLKDIAPSYGLATLIAICVYFLKYLPISFWAILPMQIILGVIVFFVFCKKTQMEEYVEMKGILSPYLKMIRSKMKNIG